MSKLGPCTICQKQSLYTCPRCFQTTCSLNCSKLHKLEISPPCSGIGKQVFETPLLANQFNWGGIMRDQSWLSKIGRKVEKNGKLLVEGKLIPASFGGNDGRLDGFSDKEQGIVGNGSRFENVKLVLLPKGMSRRLKNVTKWQPTTKLMEWTTEFIVPPSTLSPPTPSTSKIPPVTISPPQLQPSNRTLKEILINVITMRDKKGKAKALHQSSLTETIDQVIEDVLSVEMEWLESLSDLTEDLLKSVFVLLLPVIDSLIYNPAAEEDDDDEESPNITQQPIPVSQNALMKKYYLISPNSTLREALLRTTIIEFPSFYLLSREDFEREILEGKMKVIEKPTVDVSGFGSLASEGRSKGNRGGTRGGRGGRGRGGRESLEISNEDRTPDAGWSKRARITTIDQALEIEGGGEKKIKLEEIEFEFELSTDNQTTNESTEMEIALVGYESATT